MFELIAVFIAGAFVGFGVCLFTLSLCRAASKEEPKP